MGRWQLAEKGPAVESKQTAGQVVAEKSSHVGSLAD